MYRTNLVRRGCGHRRFPEEHTLESGDHQARRNGGTHRFSLPAATVIGETDFHSPACEFVRSSTTAFARHLCVVEPMSPAVSATSACTASSCGTASDDDGHHCTYRHPRRLRPSCPCRPPERRPGLSACRMVCARLIQHGIGADASFSTTRRQFRLDKSMATARHRPRYPS